MTDIEIYGILNTIYEDMGYADRGANFINEDTITEIGVTSPNLRSEFIDQIMLVLNQRFWRGIFTPDANFARAFSVDLGENGWGMLETFQHFLEASTPMWEEEDSNKIATDLVTPVSQKLSRKYYDSPLSAQFKNTIDRRNSAKIFTAEGMREFIDNATAILSASAEYFLMSEILTEIKSGKDSGDFVEYNKEHSLLTREDILETLADIRGVAKDMTIPSKLYNAESVLNSTNNSRVYILTNHIVNERINVLGLAENYHLDLSEFNISTLFAPFENELFDDTIAVVLDRRAIIMGIRTYMLSNFYVKNTLWENFWMSVEGIKGHNRFFSAVVFKGGVKKVPVVITSDKGNILSFVVNDGKVVTVENGGTVYLNIGDRISNTGKSAQFFFRGKPTLNTSDVVTVTKDLILMNT